MSQSICCVFITTCTNELVISRRSPTVDGTELCCPADLFSDTAAPCESVWQNEPSHLCLRVASWLWLSAARLTHPDVVCTRHSHGWLITSYLPWRIRALIEHGSVTDPFLCPWKAWPALWLPPRDEWLHSGPDHAVGGPLFPWLMALGCWTASRRSLLTWSDSAGDGQGLAASAANADSCRERSPLVQRRSPTFHNPNYIRLQMSPWARHYILIHWGNCSSCLIMTVWTFLFGSAHWVCREMAKLICSLLDTPFTNPDSDIHPCTWLAKHVDHMGCHTIYSLA